MESALQEKGPIERKNREISELQAKVRNLKKLHR